MTERLVLGIDPDSHNTGWAIASTQRLWAVGAVRSKEQDRDSVRVAMIRVLREPLSMLFRQWPIDLVVVEGQVSRVHHGGKQAAADPNDIIHLAQVAGGVVGICLASSACSVVMPDPERWKGQTPKEINQSRSFAHYGILVSHASGYVYPSGCKVSAGVKGASKLLQGDWKHVGDAVGLALWGARKLQSIPR